MSTSKVVMILGGTGFVGRAIVEEYLRNRWHVIITTRSSDLNEAKNKLLFHGFSKHDLKNFIDQGYILFILKANLVDKEWTEEEVWLKSFDRLKIKVSQVLRIFNLIGETSGSPDKIITSSINVLDSIFKIVQIIKFQNKNTIFCNLGSTAEKSYNYNKILSPYEAAKKFARHKIEESRLCNYHIVINYIKGKGEQKMKLAAPRLWSKLRYSHRWLFGFKISIIDVDDLANIIYCLLEISKLPLDRNKLTEIQVTNGELIFGEMIKNLLPQNKRDVPKTIIPSFLEVIFLKAYLLIIPKIKPNNQFSLRLANFAQRSLNPIRWERLRSFKTAAEIKKLSLDHTNYKVIRKEPDLIVINKYRSLIYVLREKNNSQLIQIVQKALIS